MKSKINWLKHLEHLNQSIKYSEEKCEELRAAHEKQKEKEAKLYDKLHGLLDRCLCTVYTLSTIELFPTNRGNA